MKTGETTGIGALCCILLLGACDLVQKEKEEPLDPMVEIQGHVQRFIEEAAARGHDVAAAVAAVQIATIDHDIEYEGRSLCGFAPWYADEGTERPSITFAINERCWTSRAGEDHEALVFHELGHAVLDRAHRDDRLPDGSRASIMVGTNLAGLYVGKARNRRAYYVDELFDPQTPVPEWSR